MEVDCKNTVYLSLLLAISHRAVVVLVVLLKSTKRPASNQQVSQCNKKFHIFSRRLAACLFCQCHLHGCLAIAKAKGRYGRVRNGASREKDLFSCVPRSCLVPFPFRRKRLASYFERNTVVTRGHSSIPARLC